LELCLEELATRLEMEVESGSVSVLVLVLILVACSVADLLELETVPASELELLETALGLEPEMVVESCYLVSVVVWLETVLLGLEVAIGLDTRLGSELETALDWVLGSILETELWLEMAPGWALESILEMVLLGLILETVMG
jgi:hypothetical protein